MQAGFCATMFKFARAILIRACAIRRSREGFKFTLHCARAIEFKQNELKFIASETALNLSRFFAVFYLCCLGRAPCSALLIVHIEPK